MHANPFQDGRIAQSPCKRPGGWSTIDKTVRRGFGRTHDLVTDGGRVDTIEGLSRRRRKDVDVFDVVGGQTAGRNL